MIPDEFSMPQPPERRDQKKNVENAQQTVRRVLGKYRPWMLRLGVFALLSVLGLICVWIVDSSGLKAKALAGLAGGWSDKAGTYSLLKKPQGNSAKSRNSVAVCERLVKLRPEDASAHVMLGNACVEMGRTQEAIASYHAALALDANCFDAHLGMGKAHFERGAYTEAVASYQKALKIRPGSADAHLSLGLALSNAGQYEEAMKAFQKAKELDPGIAAAQVLTGQTYLQAGMCAQAIECFKDAVRADQGHAQAYYNLGRAYLRVGDKGLALEQQRILQNLDPRLADQLLHQINQ